jgi:hypothetical protein
MRTLLLTGLLMAAGAWAQRPAMPQFPQHSTGWPAVLPPAVQNHATALAASVAGRPVPLGAPGGRAPRVFPVAAPIWYPPIVSPQIVAPPVYWLPPAVSPAPVTVVHQQAPIVVHNPAYVPDTAKPAMREYFAESRPYEAATGSKTTAAVTLIAFRDGSLMQAVAYWYEGATLHYVKPDHQMASAPLAQVDKESSARFNRERGVPFRLPE